MKDYSIEYAHIYTNQEIDVEHEFSIKILKDIFLKLKGEKSLVIMVDDYSFPDPSFNYSDMFNYAAKKGFKPDVMVRESELISSCDIVLSEMREGKLKQSLVNYIISKKKYPCSLFIATWYLIRLGKINSSFFKSKFSANKLINILPESFKPFEDNALKIIKNTKFSKSINDIENKYFEGRIIA